MAAITSRRGIDQNELYKLRYNEVLMKEGREVLVTVLQWSYADGCLSFKKQLFTAPNYSNAQYRRDFDAHQREKLDKEEPASSYDITLLYKLLRRVSNLSKDDTDWVTATPNCPTTENLVYTLKQHRNRLAHENLSLTEKDMNDILQEIQDLLVNILNTTANRFGVPTTSLKQLTDTVIQNINVIRLRVHEPLGPADISRYQDDVKALRESLKHEVLDESSNELNLLFLRLSELDLASWLLRDDYHRPSVLFTKLVIQQDNLFFGGKRKTQQMRDIDCNEIFELKRHDESHADVIIVSGEGGMGKTTFLKYIMEQRALNLGDIPELDKYDLVLYAECRNSTIKSFEQLIKHLLPQTPSKVNIEFHHFLDIILHSRILFLIDGYDEVNSASRQLIDEIFNLPGNHIQVLITSRTGRSDELSKLVPQTKRRLNLIIQGIAMKHLSDFMDKLINVLVELQDQDEMKSKLTSYICHLSRKMGEQLRCPLILTLITLVLVECPDKFSSMTTSTALYEELRSLMTGKLVSRLMDMGIASETELEKRCEQFLVFHDYLAFKSFNMREFELLPETTAALKDKCDALELPSEEVMATYFTTRRSKSGLKIIKLYTYIHLNILEFNASKHVVRKLITYNDTPNENILRKILVEEEPTIPCATYTGTQMGGFINLTNTFVNTGDDTVVLSNLSLWKYQNALIYVSGIMALSHSELLPRFSSLIIELAGHPGNTVSFVLRHVAESQNNIHIVQEAAAKLALVNNVIEWKIGTVHLSALPPVLAITQPKTININVESDPDQEMNLLPALTAISRCSSQLQLHFWHQLYTDGPLKVSDRYLSEVTCPDSYCSLRQFAGCLSVQAVMQLPRSLCKLYLKLDREALFILSEKLSELRLLDWLVIILNNTPDDQDNIPTMKYMGKDLRFHVVSAITDNKEDLTRTCSLITKLCPEHRKGNYDGLYFTSSLLSDIGSECLLKQLGEQGIRASEVRIKTSKSITDEQKAQLKKVSRTHGLGYLYISS